MERHRYSRVSNQAEEPSDSATAPDRMTYWPTALRMPWLLAVFSFILALIVVLEVAARKLPMTPRRNYFDLAQSSKLPNQNASAASQHQTSPVTSFASFHPRQANSSSTVEKKLCPVGIVTVVETVNGTVTKYPLDPNPESTQTDPACWYVTSVVESEYVPLEQTSTLEACVVPKNIIETRTVTITTDAVDTISILPRTAITAASVRYMAPRATGEQTCLTETFSEVEIVTVYVPLVKTVTIPLPATSKSPQDTKMPNKATASVADGSAAILTAVARPTSSVETPVTTAPRIIVLPVSDAGGDLASNVNVLKTTLSDMGTFVDAAGNVITISETVLFIEAISRQDDADTTSVGIDTMRSPVIASGATGVTHIALLATRPTTNAHGDSITLTEVIVPAYTTSFATRTTTDSLGEPSTILELVVTTTDTAGQKVTVTFAAASTVDFVGDVEGLTASSTGGHIADPSSRQRPTSESPSNDETGQVLVLRWPAWNVFVGSYLPVLIAVMLKTFWTPIAASANLMQPFLLLGRSAGNKAEHILFASYLSPWNNPMRMLVSGSWLGFGACVNFAIITAIGPLSSEAIFIDTEYDCTNPELGARNPCWPPRISADPYVLRLLQALLSIAAVLTLVVAWFVYKSKSPIEKDPSTMAGILALEHHPVLLDHFRSVHPDADVKELRASFIGRKYSVQHYQTTAGDGKYGIVPPTESDDHLLAQSAYVVSARAKRSAKVPQRYAFGLWDLIMFGATMTISLGLLGLVVAYYKDSSDSGYNVYMSSNSFGPSLILTALATIIALTFGILQDEMAVATPFHRLTKGLSAARSTLWLSKSSLPVVSMFVLLRHGYFVSAFAAFVAALSELLIIFVAVLPFSPGQVYLEVLISSYVCMSMLGLIVVCTIMIAVWRRGVFMPRKADTIAGVMSYFCGSKLAIGGTISKQCDE